MLSLKEAMEKYNEEIDKLRGRYGNFFGFYDIYRNELHYCTILLVLQNFRIAKNSRNIFSAY